MNVKIRDKSGKSEKTETSGNTKTYVTFLIGNELYAVDVMRVNTISGLCDIRPVPNSKNFMLGVMTIQNTIIPVIDMRIKFNLENTAYSKTTVIAIVSARGKLIGLLVDAVLNVIGLGTVNVHDTQYFTDNIDSDCIDGISKVDERLVVILNTDKLVTAEEIKKFGKQQLGEE